MGFFDKLFGKKEKQTLDQGLEKTKESFFAKITKAVAGVKALSTMKCSTTWKKPW